MADETLIEGHCHRCLEHYDECNCLCETIELCIENKCHCILNDAVKKENLDRIDVYLDTLSKVGGTLDDWKIYSSGAFLCGLEFMEITDTLREWRMDIQELDAEIQKLHNEWQELYDILYELKDFEEDTYWERECKKEEKSYISQKIQKLEKIRGYYNERKDTFHWKCYLIFKKYKAEHVF